MSSETLCDWQIKYINLLKAGKSGTTALAEVGVALETFSDARMNNAAFKSALELTEAGIGATVISVEELLRLRQAQVTETRVAAFFGMTVEEMKEALEKNPRLKSAYETGVGRGQAMIQLAQFDAAVFGGSDAMLKQLGMHVLDQTDKVKHEFSIDDARAKLAEIESKIEQKRVARMIGSDQDGKEIIEGEYSELESDVDE